VADVDADRRRQPAVEPESRLVEGRALSDAEVGEGGREDRTEVVEVVADRQAETLEGQDRVDGDLSGAVQPRPAAAADPADGPAVFGRVDAEMAAAGLPAHGDERRMLADDEDGLAGIATDLVVKATLQAQHGVELDFAEQVDLQDVRFLEHAIASGTPRKFTSESRIFQIDSRADSAAPIEWP
jgi:hypothetical protein